VFDRPPHFHVLRFPVRIELWFFVIAVLIGLNREWLPIGYVFEWMAVVFVSLLVHELGHAMAFRRFAQEPRVVLTGMGGLTYGSSPFRSRAEDIVTSLAGPVTGFVLLGLPAWLIYQQLEPGDPRFLRVVVYDLYWVSFIWSLVNLLPVLPLDGGHVVQALWGRSVARRVSVVAALAVVVFLTGSGYRYGWLFFLILAGLSGYELYNERRAGATSRVAVLPPSPGEWGGGYGGGDYGAPPSRRRRGPKRDKPMSARKARQRAHLHPVPDSPAELSRVEGPVPVGLEQVETVGWRAVRDGDVATARRALAKAPPGGAVDPFLAPSVDLLAGDVEDAVAGFVRAYAAKPEGPTGLLPATLLGKHGQAVAVAERLLAQEGPAAAFAVGGLQGHLHYAGYWVASANVGERLHEDARTERAQVAFEVACSWSRAERADLALAWVGRAIDDGFTAGSVLDNEADLAHARLDPAWVEVRARLA
jgi:Zn-dependent protease